MTDMAKTSISPMLSVRNGGEGGRVPQGGVSTPCGENRPAWGPPAFGAGELFRIENDSGAVVAQLSVGESEFWVADESARHPAKTAPYGNPALRSTRISAPGRWVYFGGLDLISQSRHSAYFK